MKNLLKIIFSPRAAGFTAVLVCAQGSVEVGGGVGKVVLLPPLLLHQIAEALDQFDT